MRIKSGHQKGCPASASLEGGMGLWPLTCVSVKLSPWASCLRSAPTT